MNKKEREDAKRLEDPESLTLEIQVFTMTGDYDAAVEGSQDIAQKRVARGNKLPLDGLEKHRAQLEEWGFTVGEPLDHLFTEVELPEGWSFVPHDDHNMYCDIHDPQGRQCGTVFYNSAPWNQRAWFSLSA
ncbi:MAG: hypothetical protein U9Q03_06120 [Patescibacteria group bacterium]|nr:hypothetical protein [Patescibacteria group bacterium]